MLQVERVTKKFGGLVALNNLSFKIKRREILGIIGPNGSGKTTLYNCITGFLPYDGDIKFLGDSIRGLSPHQICYRGIARTYQVPEIFSTISLRRNVEIGARFNSQKVENTEKFIREIISLTGLEKRQSVIAMDLNLNEMKLLMVAMAMSTNPKLLMLDEPMAGMSPTEKNQFRDIIWKIQKEYDVTLVVIEHLVKEIMGISDRIIVLHEGSVICSEKPKDVAKNKKVKEIYLGVQSA